MSAINLVFPHQLFEQGLPLQNKFPVFLVEEWLFFRQYRFHQQKIAFHRASMQSYARYLRDKGIDVTYVESHQPTSDIRKLIPQLATLQVNAIHVTDPTDNWLERRLRSGIAQTNIELVLYDSPLFLNTKEELTSFFKPSRKKFFQTSFYKNERIKRHILLDDADQPVGGKWSYDAENRKKYPRKKTPPAIHYPPANEHYKEATDYVRKHYTDNPGVLTEAPLYPIDFKTTQQWFRDFLEYRFAEFGPYEDAIVSSASILHHSVLTPMLNVGLITPQQVVEESLVFAAENDVPLNSTEGFIRQIIGWREFIRGIYECKGSEQRTRNFWGFDRKIPAAFYNGTTGIDPIDQTIKKVLRSGYCHHIERLMVLGNFMLLCEFDPYEVYRWFMELFIDAYDWVMVPNVYGMSQFADGGLLATKPYISGSNYLSKMSDYGKGPWQDTWDALFWRFMHVHRDVFGKNPRLSMLLHTFDRMDPDKQKKLLDNADSYLQSL